MIRLTLLRHGDDTVGQTIKHRSREMPNRLVAFTEMRRPVVFWNITSRCNLSCPQCYISAGAPSENELSTDEAKALMDDLASMRVPLLMFTGGEPLLRPDLWKLVGHAQELGIKSAVSTNGTMLTDAVAARMKQAGVEYVGVSLDGARQRTHDSIRGEGSYAKAISGLEACVRVGLKSGIRITATKDNYGEIPELLDLTAELKVPRFCLYWLVPSGRGRSAYEEKQLDRGQVGAVFDLLYKKAKELSPDVMEILTVDAPQDGAYLLDRLAADKDSELANALSLLECTGDSCSAGDRVANIDPQGNVYPCQFTQHSDMRIGNVRDRMFSQMWNDNTNPVLSGFRNKKQTIHGRCQDCPSMGTCGGGCRARAYYEGGDIAASDPFCIIGENGKINGSR